jgi:tRNA-splicing ligase RtcB
MEDFSKEMTEIVAKVNEDTLDESPFAYKNIFDVIELQKDSIDVVDYIKPLINIKG